MWQGRRLPRHCHTMKVEYLQAHAHIAPRAQPNWTICNSAYTWHSLRSDADGPTALLQVILIANNCEELDGPAVSALRRAIAEVKQRSFIRWVTIIYYLEFLRASEGTLSRWSRLYLHSLAPTNPHWARVVGYGWFSLYVIHKECLCPNSGDINRLMMMNNCVKL
jgi:hypothetical protein